VTRRVGPSRRRRQLERRRLCAAGSHAPRPPPLTPQVEFFNASRLPYTTISDAEFGEVQQLLCAVASSQPDTNAREFSGRIASGAYRCGTRARAAPAAPVCPRQGCAP
jgi:hypothetical protein